MQSAITAAPAAPVFLPLIDAAKLNGLGRTKAFELAAAGILETFTIGTRRYVLLESIRTLPQRLAAAGVAK